jgi:hypothetical protein
MKSVSERTWRARRARLAPSARQIERSRCRVAAPARKRLARLAHPSTNSTPTIASIACTGLPYRSRNSGRPVEEGASSTDLNPCAEHAPSGSCRQRGTAEMPRSGRRRLPRRARMSNFRSSHFIRRAMLGWGLFESRHLLVFDQPRRQSGLGVRESRQTRRGQ